MKSVYLFAPDKNTRIHEITTGWSAKVWESRTASLGEKNGKRNCELENSLSLGPRVRDPKFSSYLITIGDHVMITKRGHCQSWHSKASLHVNLRQNLVIESNLFFTKQHFSLWVLDLNWIKGQKNPTHLFTKSLRKLSYFCTFLIFLL